MVSLCLFIIFNLCDFCFAYVRRVYGPTVTIRCVWLRRCAISHFQICCGLLFCCARLAMLSSDGLPLHAPVAAEQLGSWTSSVSLYGFVWAVKHSCLSPASLNASLDPGRAALSVWVLGLNIRDFGGSGPPGSLRSDEEFLDWIVMSVRRGWTPRRVLEWMYPAFGGLLFDLASDVPAPGGLVGSP